MKKEENIGDGIFINVPLKEILENYSLLIDQEDLTRKTIFSIVAAVISFVSVCVNIYIQIS